MSDVRKPLSTDTRSHASIFLLAIGLVLGAASGEMQAARLGGAGTSIDVRAPVAGPGRQPQRAGGGTGSSISAHISTGTRTPVRSQAFGRARLPAQAWIPARSPGRTGTSGRSASIPPDFILGVQWENGAVTARYLNELGLHWARGDIALNQVIPVIEDPTLTLDDVQNSPWMIDDLLDNADWSGVDAQLRPMAEAGIDLFAVLGEGWIGTYASIDGEDATPDRLGADTYLAYIYLYSRAVVERYDGDGYKDADGIVIKHWQIENELNQAMFTTLYGWREPTGLEGLTSLWADWDFLTSLLYTLNRAVHESDPSAVTTQNLHTDIPPEYNRLFRTPGWPDAAYQWRNYMDVMGFDAYPNYYYADPIQSDTVGDRVDLLHRISGKPVIIMETGYPSGPPELGYSEEKQAQYLEAAVHSAVDAGAIGYLHFKLTSSDQPTIELTDQDKKDMAVLGRLFENGHIVALLGWTARHAEEIPHLIEVLQAVEPYWGLVDTAGNRKPAFYTMQQLAAEMNLTSTRD